MNETAKPEDGAVNVITKPPALVRLALTFGIIGVLLCLPLLIRETPYTFVIFMFLGQPLLALGFLFFAVNVFRDLKSRQLL